MITTFASRRSPKGNFVKHALFKAAALTATVVATISMTTGPALANPAPATLLQNQFLAANPVSGSPSCVGGLFNSRSIYLQAGTYKWEQIVQNVDVVTPRYIHLDAGTYKWSACITPVEDLNTGKWVYADESVLTPPNGGTPAQLGSDWQLDSDGYRTWGDRLTWVNSN